MRWTLEKRRQDKARLTKQTARAAWAAAARTWQATPAAASPRRPAAVPGLGHLRPLRLLCRLPLARCPAAMARPPPPTAGTAGLAGRWAGPTASPIGRPASGPAPPAARREREGGGSVEQGMHCVMARELRSCIAAGRAWGAAHTSSAALDQQSPSRSLLQPHCVVAAAGAGGQAAGGSAGLTSGHSSPRGRRSWPRCSAGIVGRAGQGREERWGPGACTLAAAFGAAAFVL